MMSPILFIIDESPAIHRLIEQESLEEGFTVRSFTDGPSAIEEARTCLPDIIIADYHLEGLTFYTFCEKLGEYDIIPASHLILLAGSTDRYDESNMLTKGVQGFLRKPLKPEHLAEIFEEYDEAKKGREKKKTKKTKSWPPETTMIDLEDPFLQEDLENEEGSIEIEIIQPELPQDALVEKPIPGKASPQSEARARAMSPPWVQNVPPVKKTNKGKKKPDHGKTGSLVHPQSELSQSFAVPENPALSQTEEHEELAHKSTEHNTPGHEPPTPVEPPVSSPNLRLGGTFPELDDKQTAASSTAAAGALFQKKSKRPPTERSSMAQAQDPSSALPPQLETAMRGFLNQLAQTVGQPTTDQNHQFEDLVKQTVATQLPSLVQEEVERKLSSALNEEYLKSLVQTVVQERLSDLMTQQAGTIEKSIQETMRKQTQEQVEELTPKLVQDLTEPAVQKYLPHAIKEQAETVDGLVKETAVELVMPHVHDSLDKVVREVVGERLEQLVQNVVPDLAEQHIKKEIERLTEPE